MIKTTLIALGIAATLTSVAAASPLTDYSAGKAAIDISYSSPQYEANGLDTDGPWSDRFNGNGNWDFSGTFGLGNKFAFQYAQTTPEFQSKTFPEIVPAVINPTFSARASIKDFTILHQVSPHFSLYTGLVKAVATYHYSFAGDYPSDTRNIWQIGVQSYTKLADKLTGYASIGAGKGYTAYHLGIGYEVTSNIDFNIGYDYREIKDLYDGADKYDTIVKGMKYGITYKF